MKMYCRYPGLTDLKSKRDVRHNISSASFTDLFRYFTIVAVDIKAIF